MKKEKNAKFRQLEWTRIKSVAERSPFCLWFGNHSLALQPGQKFREIHCSVGGRWMNFLVISGNLFSFGCRTALRVTSRSFISSLSFAQIRAFNVSQQPRGTNNNMADGGPLVEEYSKRAKAAVGLLDPLWYTTYYQLWQLDISFVSSRRKKLSIWRGKSKPFRTRLVLFQSRKLVKTKALLTRNWKKFSRRTANLSIKWKHSNA